MFPNPGDTIWFLFGTVIYAFSIFILTNSCLLVVIYQLIPESIIQALLAHFTRPF